VELQDFGEHLARKPAKVWPVPGISRRVRNCQIITIQAMNFFFRGIILHAIDSINF
jgi:hypothetical protein